MSEAAERAKQDLAGNLRMLRAYRKMTQQEVADRAGLHVSSVAEYEKGCGNPRIRTVARLGYALGVPAATLLSAVTIPPLDEDEEATP